MNQNGVIRRPKISPPLYFLQLKVAMGEDPFHRNEFFQILAKAAQVWVRPDKRKESFERMLANRWVKRTAKRGRFEFSRLG